MTISPALFPAVTVTVVRDRKIRTALRTNQIAGFVTVPSWKKIIWGNCMLPVMGSCFLLICASFLVRTRSNVCVIYLSLCLANYKDPFKCCMLEWSVPYGVEISGKLGPDRWMQMVKIFSMHSDFPFQKFFFFQHVSFISVVCLSAKKFYFYNVNSKSSGILG